MPHNRAHGISRSTWACVLRGRTKWVGTHSNIAAYRAADSNGSSNYGRKSMPTIACGPQRYLFAGAKIDQKTGRIDDLASG